MPLRRSSVPRGPDMQLYRRVRWGRLATFHLLDTRQYRADQACGDGYKDCPDAADPARSLPGAPQEDWLVDGFRQSDARWDLLGQQVFFGRRDNDAGAGEHGLDGLLGRLPRLPRPDRPGLGGRAGAEPGGADR